jgi:hypothetical protein
LNVDWSKKTSHTIPNAKCPVCSTKVFFYRSPDNGAVFFDDLGPPWPKHPCTSGMLNAGIIKAIEKKKVRKKNKFCWPYPCHKIEALPENEGICLHGEGGKRLFIRTRSENLKAHTPIWVRRIPDMPDKYYISSFQLVEGVVKEYSYTGFSYKGLKHLPASEMFPSTVQALCIPDSSNSTPIKPAESIQNA